MKMKMPQGKFLGAVKVGDDGQIVLPQEVLELFAIEPGETLTVLADKKKGIAIRRETL